MKTTITLACVAVALGAAIAILIRANASGPRHTAPVKSTAPATPKSDHGSHTGHTMPEKTPTPAPTPTPKPVPVEPSPLRQLVAAGYHDLGNQACPVMGNPSGGDDATFIAYNGVLVRFCCPGCDKTFLESPLDLAKAMKRDGANVPDDWLTADAHPDVVRAENTTCPVTGAPVGDSKAYAVHRGVVVRLSSPEALVAFAKDPDGHLAKAAQSGDIPAERLRKGSSR